MWVREVKKKEKHINLIKIKDDQITMALIIKNHNKLILTSKYNHNHSNINSNPNFINTNHIKCPSNHSEFNNRCIITKDRLSSINNYSNNNNKSIRLSSINYNNNFNENSSSTNCRNNMKKNRRLRDMKNYTNNIN